MKLKFKIGDYFFWRDKNDKSFMIAGKIYCIRYKKWSPKVRAKTFYYHPMIGGDGNNRFGYESIIYDETKLCNENEMLAMLI